MQESAALLAHALGWNLDSLTEESEPVIASRDLSTEFFKVKAGQVCGIHQRVAGRQAGVEKIVLDIKMYLSAPEPCDVIHISGRPDLHLKIENGVAGDDATIASLINVVPRLLAGQPGLCLLHELALPAWTGGIITA